MKPWFSCGAIDLGFPYGIFQTIGDEPVFDHRTNLVFCCQVQVAPAARGAVLDLVLALEPGAEFFWSDREAINKKCSLTIME